MGGGGSKNNDNDKSTESMAIQSTEKQPAEVDPVYEGPKITATSTQDLIVTTTLGKGSFGRVRLARHKESNTLWALKI